MRLFQGVWSYQGQAFSSLREALTALWMGMR